MKRPVQTGLQNFKTGPDRSDNTSDRSENIIIVIIIVIGTGFSHQNIIRHRVRFFGIYHQNHEPEIAPFSGLPGCIHKIKNLNKKICSGPD